MNRQLMPMVAVLTFSGGMALAAVDTGVLIGDLQAEGYNWIEVDRGPTQIKIEAVRGTEKVETVIDAETGAVLSQEIETADSDEQGRVGVEQDTSLTDFVDADGRDLDDDDDGDEDGDDDDGMDDDDDDGHDGDDDHGGDHDDDSDDDDHGDDDGDDD